MNLPKPLRQTINRAAHEAAMRNEIIIKSRLIDLALKSIEDDLILDEIMSKLREEANRLSLL